MKTRTGFVSNSSSSSFVLISPPSAVVSALSALSKEGQSLINEHILYGATNETINGQKMTVAVGEINTEDFGSSIYDDDSYEKALEDWQSFSDVVRKYGGFIKEK
jgi:hypothetical protein